VSIGDFFQKKNIYINLQTVLLSPLLNCCCGLIFPTYIHTHTHTHTHTPQLVTVLTNPKPSNGSVCFQSLCCPFFKLSVHKIVRMYADIVQMGFKE